jgi:Protein of unknown function (DUF3303)
MKYVVTWENRSNATEETAARSLQVFSKWTPQEGSTFKEFVARIDGRGGFAVVESDDPSLVLRDTALFGAFFDFSVYPVMEIADSTAIEMETVEHLRSIS